MAFLKYSLPALALAKSAFGQSCSAATTTLNTGGDATALAACQTFTGSVALATGITGDITLNNVQTITGDLTATNATQLTSLSAPSLTTIGGEFLLEGLTVMTGLNMVRLTNVNNLMWVTLPQLQGLTFTTGLTQVNALNIQDTALQNINGINIQTAQSVAISNNLYLTSINMELANVSGGISITSNANGQMSANFPNLIGAQSLTVADTSSLTLPSLTFVNQSLNLYENSFTSISMPNLTTVRDFVVDNNNQMTNFSVPVLSQVGGVLSVENNTALTGNISFPAVVRVGGAIVVLGDFSGLSMPAINDVEGAVTIISTKDLSNTCPFYENNQGNGEIIRGQVTCSPTSGSAAATGGAGASGSSASATGGSSSSSSTSAPKSDGRSQYKVPTVIGVSGLAFAFFSLY